jgi:hypothetical protein
MGAYGALRRRSSTARDLLKDRIISELERQAKIAEDLRQAKDGWGILRASYLIAHNCGDLARVGEAWALESDDPVVRHMEGLRDGRLAFLMTLNRDVMADENHRHFTLRKPRCLRRSVDLLLPCGPLLDDWGARLARHPGLTPEEVGEVAEALVDGWVKLPETVGYARALAGIESAFPGGLRRLKDYLPAKIFRTLESGKLRVLVGRPRRAFELSWAARAF